MEYFFSFEKLAYVQQEKPPGCILCGVRDRAAGIVDLTIHSSPCFVVCVNLYPYNPGHLMVFPKRHITDIRSYTPAETVELQATIGLMLSALDALYSPHAYNIGYNMGLAAGASIEHLHLHLIPRFPRELGIADLLAGKRVLVESPIDTARKIRSQLESQAPSSMRIS
jgi:ATP adenylyltransferase